MSKQEIVRPELFALLFKDLATLAPTLTDEAVILLAWSEADRGLKVTLNVRGLAADLVIPDAIIPPVPSLGVIAKLITEHSVWKQFFLEADRPQERQVGMMVFQQKYRRQAVHG